ncbi:MAG: cell division protein FtsK [Candidatus Colwellbacteria bacterium CG10_big_fil_rev_8_21_14_0_10_42_22]|uniref:Cell division protein FtsK n=1 Tax=Candidatus Colwellbacteria bacterium CG10_big_fil_rev_8_21_14_0_10_42_22 TaxID=1974540 RepID=A0A2H0VGU3_9BACT|nr:MAG: cell division protein FtsK [Candidatus Colwellbacteria bacterium CG10_big_fil_rev_8_21_14_0_10_42_22]
MAKKRRKKHIPKKEEEKRGLHPDTKASILAVVFLGVALVLILSKFGWAGPVGDAIYQVLEKFLGWGYFLMPTAFILISINAVAKNKQFLATPTLLGALFFILSGLGFLDLLSSESGGLVGEILGSLENLFGKGASVVINLTILVASILAVLNVPIRLKLPERKQKQIEEEPNIVMPESIDEHPQDDSESGRKEEQEAEKKKEKHEGFGLFSDKGFQMATKDYKFPPLKLLKTGFDKPTVGDIKANANIIKRTLESFGIPVEMGEITIGPKVTRYTLKPAEGIKLSRIEALNQDLSLALAAHPIRIEAPIPGKSLVGIEVPNKVASIVRLGSLLADPEFKKSSSLGFPLGRDVSGTPIFASIAKMPHMLIAGSTGSGKSIAIHSLIVSLLYKNTPATLRFIMIDPKKVELSTYEGIPHLLSPVITEGKRAVAALRFAIQEMERRYELLLDAGKRDVVSYNSDHHEDMLPFMVIVIDELADLMAAFGREVETSIVRLAQMARATGIHLVVSTQRPSVEVITGLIKANITTRLALQVASQVDSRTILDMAGAEKLLGGGDMLFISAEHSKPKRIQGGFITEDEINSVVKFIRTENKVMPEDALGEEMEESLEKPTSRGFDAEDDEDDELYKEALDAVIQAKKASASYLQRRLRVGYARAARLLDIMEARGVIGPADGAKPRDILIETEDSSIEKDYEEDAQSGEEEYE